MYFTFFLAHTEESLETNFEKEHKIQGFNLNYWLQLKFIILSIHWAVHHSPLWQNDELHGRLRCTIEPWKTVVLLRKIYLYTTGIVQCLNLPHRHQICSETSSKRKMNIKSLNAAEKHWDKEELLFVRFLLLPNYLQKYSAANASKYVFILVRKG